MSHEGSGDDLRRFFQPRRAEDFAAFYADAAPWDIGRPQKAFQTLAKQGTLQGRVLDVGCGTGEHALMAAELGLEATGIDASAAAIATAERKALHRGLQVRFLVWDALRVATLGEQFDTVLDSGLFHVFGDDDRRLFLENLAAVIPTGGRFYMLCFSELQPGEFGPRRVTQQEIKSSFAAGWRVESIAEARFEVTTLPDGASAWFARMTRT